MNLAEILLDSNQGAVVQQIAQQLGIGQVQARDAAQAVVPALARGVQRNALQPGGLEALLGALKQGDHGRYLERPAELGRAETISDGNAILGHILGSKDVSRNVAGHASQQSGLDSALVRKMLPILAAAVMGALSKQTAGGSAPGPVATQAAPTGLDALSGFLDADGDGSVADDLLGLAKKFF